MATVQKCKPCPETDHCGGANQTNRVVHNITVECNSAPDKKNQKHRFSHMFHRSSHSNEHEKGQGTQKHHQQQNHQPNQHGHQQQQKGHMLGQCFGTGLGHDNAIHGQKQHHASGGLGTTHGAGDGQGAVVSAEKKKSEHDGAVICPPEKKAANLHGWASNGKGHKVVRTEKREEYVMCEVQKPAGADHCGNGQSVVSCVKKERVRVKMQVK